MPQILKSFCLHTKVICMHYPETLTETFDYRWTNLLLRMVFSDATKLQGFCVAPKGRCKLFLKWVKNFNHSLVYL